MAECPSCNTPIKDGDWTCGACGAPVGAAAAPGQAAGSAGAYGAADGYGAASAGGYGAAAGGYGGSAGGYGGAPAGPAAPSSASPGLVKAVLVIGILAVVAIVLVWFFALRGPATTGEEFVGTWTATTAQGIATVGIEQKAEDAFSVTLTGTNASQTVTVPAHLDGEDLLITMDDFSQIAGEANAEAFKATLTALAGDFELVFRSVDATHLDLRITGTSAGGDDFDETIPLTAAATAP